MEAHPEFPEPFDCLATAAVLRSGAGVAVASHTAAVIALLPISKGGPAAWIGLGSLLVWAAGIYLAARVQIDARFFKLLAAHPPGQLDRYLEAAKFRKNISPRTTVERRRGALKLWRGLVFVVVGQIALLLLALLRGIA